jgi:hypothetical protein
MSLESGLYVIVNQRTNKALDSNHGAAIQVCPQHPRVFTWSPDHNSPNHAWFVEKLSNGHYLLKTRDGAMSLDGNIAVPQHSTSHPAPFLYPTTPNSPNHRWILTPTNEYNTFVIVNEANGLALDGNDEEYNAFQDSTHKTPFLWQPVHSAENHRWVFRPLAQQQQTQYVPPPQPSVHTQYVPPPQQQQYIPQIELPSGRYVIVNRQTGLALDGNYHGARQLSKHHRRVHAWKPVFDAMNHQWSIEKVTSNGEYMLTTDFKGPKLALDGNTNAPQHVPTHPTPFLFTPTPTAPNHRWRIVPVTGLPNTFMIINVANGKCLDGNVSAIAHYDAKHQSPFLWDPVPDAPNHHWILSKVVNTSSTSHGSTLAGAAIGFAVAGPLGAVVGAVVGSSASKKKQTTVVNQKILVPPPQQYQQPKQQVIVQRQQQQQQQPPQQQHSTHYNTIPPLPQQQQSQHSHYSSAPPLPYQQQQFSFHNAPQYASEYSPLPDQYNQSPQFTQVHTPSVPQFVPVYPMDYNAFQGLLHSIKTEAFENNRLNIVRTAAQHNYFTCDQLAQLLKITSFSKERSEIARAIVPRIVDRQNKAITLEILNFSAEREFVESLFQQHHHLQ